MWDAIGGLTKQQGLIGMLAIHNYDQLLSERLDLRRGSVGIGKMDARGRSYAIAIVAVATAGFLKHRIQSDLEWPVLRQQGDRKPKKANRKLTQASHTLYNSAKCFESPLPF
jgi:hypothetical protein